MKTTNSIGVLTLVSVLLTMPVFAKTLETRAEVKEAISGIFKPSCIKAMNDGAVQMNQKYVSNVCECLACIFNEFYADDLTDDFINSGTPPNGDVMGMVVMDKYQTHCENYYFGYSSFDPCAWAKEMGHTDKKSIK